MYNNHYDINMTIHTDTCRIHESPTGQKRISLSSDFSDKMDLPLKTKLIIEYDNVEKILIIKRLDRSKT